MLLALTINLLTLIHALNPESICCFGSEMDWQICGATAEKKYWGELKAKLGLRAEQVNQNPQGEGKQGLTHQREPSKSKRRQILPSSVLRNLRGRAPETQSHNTYHSLLPRGKLELAGPLFLRWERRLDPWHQIIRTWHQDRPHLMPVKLLPPPTTCLKCLLVCDTSKQA